MALAKSHLDFGVQFELLKDRKAVVSLDSAQMNDLVIQFGFRIEKKNCISLYPLQRMIPGLRNLLYSEAIEVLSLSFGKSLLTQSFKVG